MYNLIKGDLFQVLLHLLLALRWHSLHSRVFMWLMPCAPRTFAWVIRASILFLTLFLTMKACRGKLKSQISVREHWSRCGTKRCSLFKIEYVIYNSVWLYQWAARRKDVDLAICHFQRFQVAQTFSISDHSLNVLWMTCSLFYWENPCNANNLLATQWLRSTTTLKHCHWMDGSLHRLPTSSVKMV